MWVEFTVVQGEDGQVVIEKYRLDEEVIVNLPRTSTTPDFLAFLLGKTEMVLQEIIVKGTVKINTRMSDYEEWVRQPLQAQQRPIIQVDQQLTSAMSQFLGIQASKLQQQREMMNAMWTRTQNRAEPRNEPVRPDVFDGQSQSPTTWIDFNEYAATTNGWMEDVDQSRNLRPFLTGIAEKRYDLRIAHHANGSWDLWRASFVSSFDQNPVERWDRVIFYKHRGGSLLDYFYEKRRLLHLADANLPETYVVPLVIHGMTRECQGQVQTGSPVTVEDLLYALKNVSIDPAPSYPAMWTNQQW